MKNTYISKIYSRNLILDHMLLSAPKIYVQMIPKNKDPLQDNLVNFRLNFFSLNRDQDRL